MTSRQRYSIAVIAVAVLIAVPVVAQPPARPARTPDVPYEPSPPAAVKAMLDLAKVGPGDLVYDLGSGDGRIVIAAVKDYGARGVGIDIDSQRITESNANARQAGVTDRVTFIEGDLFTTDFSPATVVTLFLWPEINLKLRPALRKLKPGTRIVSYIHDMGDWRPDQKMTVNVPNGERSVYLWVIR